MYLLNGWQTHTVELDKQTLEVVLNIIRGAMPTARYASCRASSKTPFWAIEYLQGFYPRNLPMQAQQENSGHCSCKKFFVATKSKHVIIYLWKYAQFYFGQIYSYSQLLITLGVNCTF